MFSAAVVSLALFSTLSMAATPTVTAYAPSNSASLVLSAMTYKGCYSDSSPLNLAGYWQYQSTGYCQIICVAKNQAVMGLTTGDTCYCGGDLPADSDKVDDSKCSTTCNGWPSQKCGAQGFYSVWLTGTDDSVGANDSDASSTSSGSKSSTTSSSATVITSIAPGKTVIITQAASVTPSASGDKKSGGSSSVGIAVGVVVGIVVLAALIGGGIFFYRQRKRKEAEAYTKQAQGNDYATGGYGRTGTMRSANDARLDPEAMMQRRMSDGSIADNEDYSRRILQVTNPDGR